MSRMSELDAELNNLMELREAVRCYLSWVWDARQGVDDTGAIDFWEGEMARLSEWSQG